MTTTRRTHLARSRFSRMPTPELVQLVGRTSERPNVRDKLRRAGQAASSGTSCVERDKLPGFQGDRRADGPVRRHRRGGMRRRNEEGPGHRDRSPPPPDGAAVGTTSTAWRAEKSEQSPLQRAGGHGVTARVEFPALYAGKSTQGDSERDAIRVPGSRSARTPSRARARSTSSRQAISTSSAASRVARGRPRGVARETPSRNAVAPHGSSPSPIRSRDDEPGFVTQREETPRQSGRHEPMSARLYSSASTAARTARSAVATADATRTRPGARSGSGPSAHSNPLNALPRRAPATT
jgi:hypothetical protein